MIMFKIAFRNMFRQKRRSILTGLTMVGGIVLLSLSLAISKGTYGRVIDLFTRMHTCHLQIHQKDYLDRPSIYRTIDDWRDLAAKCSEVPGVRSWTPRVYSAALAFQGNKTTGASLIGIDPVLEKETTTLAATIDHGTWFSSPNERVVAIGKSLADILKADVGDELVLIGQAADGSIANDLFRIIAVMGKGNNSAQQMNCYMPLETAQSFLELGERVHELALIVRDYEDAIEMAPLVAQAIGDPDLQVAPWQDVERQFYQSMKADMDGMWITLSIIMLIVAIGVLNTVLMTILERTREFGVLKALGTKPITVFWLIVTETGFLALLASVVGTILSLLLNAWFTNHGIAYPEPIDVGGIAVTKMQALITWQSFWIPVAITVCTAVLVSTLPAIRAARVMPIRAMRTH